MSTLKTLACTIVASVALIGCATKNYPTMEPLAAETRGDCATLEAQLARTSDFRKQVAQESEFGGADVLAFLIDFGIGNAMAKDAAVKSADEREAAIRARQRDLGCTPVLKAESR